MFVERLRRRVPFEPVRERRTALAVMIVMITAAASAFVLPRSPSTPASVALTPATLPLAAGHALETPPEGRTTDLGSPRAPVRTTGPVSRRASGLWLAPRSSGTAVVRLRPPRDSLGRALVYVSADAYGPVTTTFSVRGGAGAARDLGQSAWSGLAQRLDVTPEARDGVLNLTISTTNTSREPVLMASRVVTLVDPGVDWPPRPLVAIWAVLLCLAVVALVLFSGAPLPAALAVVATLALAAKLRIDQLVAVAESSLLPDAVFYRYLADGMDHFYDTGSRDPLWPAVIRFWFTGVGSSDLNLRILTVVLSVALVGAVYAFATRATGSRIAGVGAAALLAVNETVADAAASGLREELYSLLLVLFAHVLLVKRDWNLTSRVLALAMLVSFLALLRITTLSFVPLLLLLGLLHGLRVRDLAVPVACALALVTPYLVYAHGRFGDALWSSNINATWYRNYEFVLRDGRGCDGCPTIPEMLASATYAGTHVSATAYVFGMHSPTTVVRNTSRGLYDLLLHPKSLLGTLFGHGGVWLLYFAGLAAAVFTARIRELVLFVVLGINLLAFVVPIGAFDTRLAFHVVPFMLVIAAFPIAITMRTLERRRRPTRLRLRRRVGCRARQRRGQSARSEGKTRMSLSVEQHARTLASAGGRR